MEYEGLPRSMLKSSVIILWETDLSLAKILNDCSNFSVKLLTLPLGCL